MDQLKTGYLVNAPPESMFYGRLLGSVIGAFVASGIYRLYASIFEMGGKDSAFPIPIAHVWISSAKLVYGAGLPLGVFPFAAVASVISATCAIIRIVYRHKTWADILPSGIAVAIGEF
jgi:uncharacterized oligopeptide transporter (OPT) family protein